MEQAEDDVNVGLRGPARELLELRFREARRKEDVRRAIVRALIQNMDATEVWALLMAPATSGMARTKLQERLTELSTSVTGAEALTLLAREMLDAEKDVPAKRRATLDRALERLVPLLPAPAQLDLARDLLARSRAAPRRLGRSILAIHGEDSNLLRLFDDGVARVTVMALRTVVSSKEGLEGRATMLLSALKHVLVGITTEEIHIVDNRYNAETIHRQMVTIFQRLLESDSALAMELSSIYPVEFIWGAGRVGNPELVTAHLARPAGAGDSARRTG